MFRANLFLKYELGHRETANTVYIFYIPYGGYKRTEQKTIFVSEEQRRGQQHIGKQYVRACDTEHGEQP